MEKTRSKKYGLGWIFGYTKGTRAFIALFALIILIATGLEMSIAFFLRAFVDIAMGESDASLLTVGLFAAAVMGVAGIMYMLSSILSKFIYGRTERKLRTGLLDIIFTRRMRHSSGTRRRPRQPVKIP